MIVMPVPKDVRVFKPKFIGPFNKREFLGVFVACIIMLITFFVTTPFAGGMTMTQRATCCLIPAVIPLACGFVDIQEMPIWVYVWNLIILNFLAPRHRVYKTSNTFEEFAVRNRITMEDLDDEPATNEKERKNKKREYEKSLKEFVASHPEYESFQ